MRFGSGCGLRTTQQQQIRMMSEFARAAVAQLAARRSHDPKVGSSILSCRICSTVCTHALYCMSQFGMSMRSTLVGFDLTWVDTIGLAGRRMNHAAKVSMVASLGPANLFTPCKHKPRTVPGKQELMETNKLCRDPGSNRGPSDLQSDALPTELSRL